MKESPTLKQIQDELHALANKKITQNSQRFFKTGPGQYGEGDQFLGIRVPVLRTLAKKGQDLSLAEVENLLHSKWHEARSLALMILVLKAEKARKKNLKNFEEYVDFYLKNRAFVNNWDLVDGSAPYILGHDLLLHPHKRELLYRYVKSKILWERRIAVLATFTLLKAGDFKDILALAQELLNDKEDLMHKAVGWMLRELGKKDEQVLRKFLDEHTPRMPRTMLRYAIEKFSEKDRKYYLTLK